MDGRSQAGISTAERSDGVIGDYDCLRYRRQFLLARGLVDGLSGWQHHRLGDCHLFVHPDLEVTMARGPIVTVYLIGHIFDPYRPEFTNQEIVSALAENADTFDLLVQIMRCLVGRYVIIYRDRTVLRIVHDPLGLREVYYCSQFNKVIAGSQPNLLDEFSQPRLGSTKDQQIVDFYRNDIRKVRSGRLWVGEETYYQAVKHLMPNHCLDVASLTRLRYWPNRRLERMDLDLAVKESCTYLKGALRAISSRHEVMMAVTSGIDSRTLLAASKDIRSLVYYFINKKPPLTDHSADIRIPMTMLAKLDLPFHVHDATGPVDKKFRNIFLSNTFMSSELLLPAIYNVYHKDHQNRVNLLGVGEIGRDYYGSSPRFITGYYLAHCLHFRKSRYATIQCQKWLEEARNVSIESNVGIMRLFLWEMLLGNWGSVGNSESDIAIEEFDPYDSHFIYETMLSVAPEHTIGSLPILFKAMFMEMWPELLGFPFNPPDSVTDAMIGWLDRFGIYARIKKARFWIDYVRYGRELSDCRSHARLVY